MSGDVLVLAEHADGRISDGTHELLAIARKLAAELGGSVAAALLGPADLAAQLGGADQVISIDDPVLAVYQPQGWELALTEIIERRSPRLVLLSTATAGLDLAPAIAIRWEAPLATNAVAVEASGDSIVATCSLLGGKLFAEVELPGGRAVVAAAAGTFRPGGGGPAAPPPDGQAPAVITFEAPPGLASLAVTLLGVSGPPAGDADITSADVLISVGRGIGSPDDLELAAELGEALGAPLSASRPVVDAGWLPKSRQVGKSGLIVKPKAYLAFGISGAPEHLEGMRDAGLIIACNTDPAAPIFEVAHYGTTVDLFDLIPALTEALAG